MKKRKRRSDRNHAIYMITCKPTGERYVGITAIRGRAFLKSVKLRWSNHVYHAVVEGRDYPLQRAIREYGEGLFSYELLMVVRGKKEAHQLELDIINQLRPELNVEGTKKKSNRNLLQHSGTGDETSG